mgnify:CR=1 FL=1
MIYVIFKSGDSVETVAYTFDEKEAEAAVAHLGAESYDYEEVKKMEGLFTGIKKQKTLDSDRVSSGSINTVFKDIQLSARCGQCV